jgi:enterochelin esterase family protein
MKLEEHLLHSRSGEYARKVWLLSPPRGVPEKIALFLDGEYYLQEMKASSLILHLQKRKRVPPLLCAFVSHLDKDARHRDLTCNPRYADFILSDLLPWLREKVSPPAAAQHLIAGVSLSGLTAAWLALTHPEIFPQCLSQSGSFWWNGEWLTENEAGVTHGELRQDVSQVSACRRLAAALQERGHPVHHHLYRGGHAIKPWKKELPGALEWLLASG